MLFSRALLLVSGGAVRGPSRCGDLLAGVVSLTSGVQVFENKALAGCDLSEDSRTGSRLQFFQFLGAGGFPSFTATSHDVAAFLATGLLC